MFRKTGHCLLGGFVWALALTPLLAHHEVSAKFDTAKRTTLNGLVTSVDWASPHVHVLMNVVSGGRAVNWAVELESPIDLERSGWTFESLKPGDAVIVQGLLSRDGTPQVWGNSIVLRGTNKPVFTLAPEASVALKPAPAKSSAL